MRVKVLFILVLGVSWTVSPLLAQSDPEQQDWSQVVFPLVLEGDSNFLSFEPLDTVVNQYAFFFTGEEHRKRINTQLQGDFLLYLHRHAGVRNLIVEGGYSYGFLLNVYLQTGNERILDKVLAVAPICPRNQRAMFRRIYAYNQRLPQSERIHVTGIDLEYAPELALQVLHSLLPAKDPHRKIRRNIRHLVKTHRSRYLDEAELERLFNRMSENLSRNKEEWKAYWGDYFPIFELIVENTVQGYAFDWFNMTFTTKSWIKREERMFRNFLVLQPYLRPGGSYGQFGAFHAQLEKGISWDFPTIAQQLNKRPSSPVKGKVMAITRYLRTFSDEYRQWDEVGNLENMIQFIEETYPDRVVLCRLAGDEDLFPNMSASFQYMIYIDEDLELIRCN